MSDSEEYVITRCITSMSTLIGIGLFRKHDICDLLKETVAYLLHPNIWIRLATAGKFLFYYLCKVSDSIKLIALSFQD